MSTNHIPRPSTDIDTRLANLAELTGKWESGIKRTISPTKYADVYVVRETSTNGHYFVDYWLWSTSTSTPLRRGDYGYMGSTYPSTEQIEAYRQSLEGATP